MLGRSVQDTDLAVVIDAENARAGACEHRFAEPPAAVDQVASAHQVIALRAQIVRHPIEGLAELPEIALRPVDRDLDVQIAGRNHVGGADQAADR